MAFLPQNHLSREEIEANFDYVGLVFGIVSVYVKLHETEHGPDADLAVRNWFPEWLLDLAEAVTQLYLIIADEEMASFPIKITGEIVK